MIAALFVQANGCYAGLPDVDLWPEDRDARRYDGPWPVVAHPPCKRWGRYATGGPAAKVRHEIGDDQGCFAAALVAVRRFGGVIEHPEGSHAWKYFGLKRPPRAGGWITADACGGATCCVEQGHYGHPARKATWLYGCMAVGCDLPSLRWGSSGQRLPAYAVERYGYEKARRIGVMAAIGGKDKTARREATPPEFRDLLLSMVRPLAAGRAAA